MTWRRVAPTARSSPSSGRRSVTLISMVLTTPSAAASRVSSSSPLSAVKKMSTPLTASIITCMEVMCSSGKSFARATRSASSAGPSTSRCGRTISITGRACGKSAAAAWLMMLALTIELPIPATTQSTGPLIPWTVIVSPRPAPFLIATSGATSTPQPGIQQGPRTVPIPLDEGEHAVPEGGQQGRIDHVGEVGVAQEGELRDDQELHGDHLASLPDRLPDRGRFLLRNQDRIQVQADDAFPAVGDVRRG